MADIETQFKQGSQLLAQKQWLPAEKIFRTILQTDDKHLEAMNALANVLKNGLGRLADAIKLYEDALVVDPTYWKANFNLGTHYVTSDPKKALEYFEKVIAVNPTFVSVYNAAFKACSNDPALSDKALDYLNKCVELDPKNTAIRLNLASLLSKKNKYKESREQFALVLEQNPSNEIAQTANFNLGVLHTSHLTDYPKAREYYEKALALNQSHIETKRNFAHLLLNQLKDYTLAAQYYRELVTVKAEPKIAAIFHAGLGTSLLALRINLEEAVYHLKQASTLDTDTKEYKQKFDDALLRRSTTPSLFASRISSVEAEPNTSSAPLDLASVEAESIEAALAPFNWNYPYIVSMAKDVINQLKAVNLNLETLTVDEATAIWLFTSAPPTTELIDIATTLNKALLASDKSLVTPYLPFLKLFISGVSKMPRVNCGFNRGCLGDLSAQYQRGTEVVWSGIASATRFVDSLETKVFLDDKADRTHLILSTPAAFDIRALSRYPDDCEVIILPQTKLRVSSSRVLRNGLRLIQLHAVQEAS